MIKVETPLIAGLGLSDMNYASIYPSPYCDS